MSRNFGMISVVVFNRGYKSMVYMSPQLWRDVIGKTGSLKILGKTGSL